MRRVAIIEPVGGHGGMDFYDYGLAEGLANNNCEVFYHTCSKTNVRSLENVETLLTFGDVWQKGKLGKLRSFLGGYKAAFKHAEKNNVEIVHLHFFQISRLNLMVLRMAKNYPFKKVITLHDVNPLVNSSTDSMHKKTYALTDHVVVHNEYSRRELLQKPIDASKISIVPHGNYLPFVKPVKSKSPDEVLQLLFFGQIKTVKGLDILLRALSIAIKEDSNIRLTIAGRPWKSDISTYRDLITELGLNDFVTTRFDYIPNEEVSSYFEACDIVVLPYKRIYQSGVLILSMSYGKPCLTSDLEPFEEIISHNQTGYLFKSEDADDLASSILDLAKNKNEILKVKENADQLIRDKYDWNVIGSKTLEIYEQLLSKKS